MARRVISTAMAAMALVASTAMASADEAGDCYTYGSLESDLAVARVAGEHRTFFVKGTSAAKGCPGMTDACREKAFVVPGDRVIVGVTRNGFSCANYVGAKGAERSGWLPAGSLVREDPAPVGPKDWVGTWVAVEAEVTIRSGQAGRLSVRGEATYGALDPDRVRRGAVNSGEIDGEIAPDGARLAFDMGTETLPVDKGDVDDCKVWMRRLGPYLLVDDNRKCGGMNVTFNAAYRRKP